MPYALRPCLAQGSTWSPQVYDTPLRPESLVFPWRARVLGGRYALATTPCLLGGRYALATAPRLLGGRVRVLLEQRLRHADAVHRRAHDPARVARALAGGVEAGQAGAPG